MNKKDTAKLVELITKTNETLETAITHSNRFKGLTTRILQLIAEMHGFIALVGQRLPQDEKEQFANLLVRYAYLMEELGECISDVASDTIQVVESEREVVKYVQSKVNP